MTKDRLIHGIRRGLLIKEFTGEETEHSKLKSPAKYSGVGKKGSCGAVLTQVGGPGEGAEEAAEEDG